MHEVIQKNWSTKNDYGFEMLRQSKPSTSELSIVEFSD